MSKKKLEKALYLTDEMILIQGIVLMEHGLRLMQWNNPTQLKVQLDALETILDALLKDCTQTQTAEMLYSELGGDR